MGMQVLMDYSEENNGTECLGLIKGKVKKFQSTRKNQIKIPHMGWNTVKTIINHPVIKRKRFDSYFVHSYNSICKNKKNILAVCDYKQNITAIVGSENIIGTQFHPEKSQKIGLEILKNFINWNY